MLALLEIVAPIFLMMAAGYCASRARLMSDAEADALSRFVTLFAVPALLCLSVARLDLGAHMRLDLMTTYYGASIATFLLCVALSRRVFAARPGDAVTAGFCALFGNTVFVGMPIIQRAFGPESQAAMFAIISLNAPIMYFVGVTAMETQSSNGAGALAAAKKVVKALSRNPMALGTGAGFTLNLTGAAPPAVMIDALEILGAAALPGGLFAVGAALTRYDLRASLGETALVTALKLGVCPLLALALILYVFDMPPAAAQTALVMAALPGGMNIYLFAVMYRRGEALAASVLLSATAVSVITLPLWLALARALYATP